MSFVASLGQSFPAWHSVLGRKTVTWTAPLYRRSTPSLPLGGVQPQIRYSSRPPWPPGAVVWVGLKNGKLARCLPGGSAVESPGHSSAVTCLVRCAAVPHGVALCQVAFFPLYRNPPHATPASLISETAQSATDLGTGIIFLRESLKT